MLVPPPEADPSAGARPPFGNRHAPVRRPRVAFGVDSMAASGGTELNAVRVAEALTERGLADVSVFTLRADGPMRARYEAAGVPVHEVPVRSLVGPEAARQMLALARQLRAARFDVAHSHDLYTNVILAPAARLAGVPAVIASKRWIVWRRSHRLLNRVAFRFAHRALANSHEVAGTLTAEDGVPAGRVAVVPNFVEEAAFARWPAAEVARRRAAFGIPAGAPVVGIVARLREEKNVGLLVDAVAALGERAPAPHVLVIGDGPEQDALAARARASGLGERVVFAGHLPNRPNPHQLFDVSVLCSAHEGFPNTLVEAMAAARPVVATRVGGVPDAVVDGHTGALVAPGDVAGFASALASVLGDPGRARAMGAAGEARARTEFHIDVALPRLVELYTALLARAGRRAGA